MTMNVRISFATVSAAVFVAVLIQWHLGEIEATTGKILVSAELFMLVFYLLHRFLGGPACCDDGGETEVDG